VLYGAERLGKAVRSPAKDTLLSHASTRTGRGAAFGVHQAMDQLGAVLGPLLLAAVLAARHDDYRTAFGVLAIPGALVLAVLVWLWRRVPDPAAYEERETGGEPQGRVRLPPVLWRYVAAVGVLSCGIASFPLLAFHAQTRGIVSAAQIPILFALAMFVDGLSGLVMGRVYDRRGGYVLLAVPVAACAAATAFSANAALVWIGVAVWGVVNGVLDSTVKAVVTELVDRDARASAFGWLALVRGVGLLVAGAVLGVAYDYSITLTVVLIVAANAVAFAGLWPVVSRSRRRASPR
jgi:MFS family permease